MVEENKGNVLVVEENNRNVVAVEVVLVEEEGKQWKCGGGVGWKTIEMWCWRWWWWWWWWWRRRMVEEEENNRILWPENLYKCATFYLFLSLHFAPEELT